MRTSRRRVAFSDKELLCLSGVALYGLIALGYAVGGGSFLAWCLVLALVLVPGLRLAGRRRRRRLAESRRRRRRARLRSYAELQDAADW